MLNSRQPDDVVARPRLSDVVKRYRTVLLRASSGYGKTVLARAVAAAHVHDTV